VPFWAFALTIAHPGYRRPSESDLRWQHYSNLAYGAKGLWYFTYWAPTGWPGWDPRAIVDGREGAPTDLYEAVKALNHAVLGMGDLLLRLRSVEVVHTRPPAGQRAFEPGRWWIAGVQAEDALVGFFEDPDGVPHALIVNKRHGPGLRARDADASVVLTFSPRVHAVHALNWLDGATGPLALDAGRASLTIAGGTGVLLRADVGPRGRTEEAWPPAP
jgi:hypothetical protein